MSIMTASADFTIRRLSPAEARSSVPALSAILLDCVEGGASVGFMAPLAHTTSQAFWTRVADGVAAGERILFVAEDKATGTLVGTVQVIPAGPENQPHRADISKMLVQRRARRRGIGAALMRAAEEGALGIGKTVLVLDTASVEAERLYERMGWVRVGTVPDFALLPDGRYCDTVFFYKALKGAV
jgi:GNAT superfamily N-acetyltransferase